MVKLSTLRWSIFLCRKELQQALDVSSTVQNEPRLVHNVQIHLKHPVVLLQKM